MCDRRRGACGHARTIAACGTGVEPRRRPWGREHGVDHERAAERHPGSELGMDQHAEQPPPSEPRRLGEVDERERRDGRAKRQAQLRPEARPRGDGQRVRLHHVHRERIERVRDVGGLRVRGHDGRDTRAQKDPPPFPITMMDAGSRRPQPMARRHEGVVRARRRHADQVQTEGRERARELGEHERALRARAEPSPLLRDARDARGSRAGRRGPRSRPSPRDRR